MRRDGPPARIKLPDEDAGPLGVRRVVFDHSRSRDTGDHLTRKDTVRRGFVVAMGGYSHLPALDKLHDKPKRLAHGLASSGGPSRHSLTPCP